MMNIEIRIRNMPFANPESVSILPYPYVKRSLGGQVAIIEAKRPTPIAMQSKPIWMASDIRPRLFVQIPYNICIIM